MLRSFLVVSLKIAEARYTKKEMQSSLLLTFVTIILLECNYNEATLMPSNVMKLLKKFNTSKEAILESLAESKETFTQ